MTLSPPRTKDSPAHTARRLTRVVIGLAVCGIGMGLMVGADLGLGPWQVLHQGLSRRMGMSIGTLSVLVSFVVLLAWIPLRQRPGLGTVLAVVIVGPATDAVIAALPPPDVLATRLGVMAVGVVLIGLGSGMYIGAGLGPGPRDGLMTGLAARGHSLRVARTAVEAAALAGGWLLGGTIGAGTLVFAFGIGPLVQLFLRHVGGPTFTAPAE